MNRKEQVKILTPYVMLSDFLIVWKLKYLQIRKLYNIVVALKFNSYDILLDTFIFLWDYMTQKINLIYFILQINDNENNKKNVERIKN